jgi:hypothetical protein
MPAVVGSALFLQLSFEWLANPTYFLARRLTNGATLSARPFYFLPPRPLSYLLIAGVIALALRFAFLNHRSADRPARRAWSQVILMSTFVIAGIIIGAAWQALRQ